MNDKGTDQSAQMHRLICAFVADLCEKQGLFCRNGHIIYFLYFVRNIVHISLVHWEYPKMNWKKNMTYTKTEDYPYLGIFISNVKVLNYRHPKYCCHHPKILTNWPYCREMPPKDGADGIANSVDPDQSSLIGVCTVCTDLSVRKLRIITVASFIARKPVLSCCSKVFQECPKTKLMRKKLFISLELIFFAWMVTLHKNHFKMYFV